MWPPKAWVFVNARSGWHCRDGYNALMLRHGAYSMGVRIVFIWWGLGIVCGYMQ